MIRTSTLPPLTVSGLVETVMMSRSSGDLAIAATDPAVIRPAIKTIKSQRENPEEPSVKDCIVSSPFIPPENHHRVQRWFYLKAINPTKMVRITNVNVVAKNPAHTSIAISALSRSRVSMTFEA